MASAYAPIAQGEADGSPKARTPRPEECRGAFRVARHRILCRLRHLCVNWGVVLTTAVRGLPVVSLGGTVKSTVSHYTNYNGCSVIGRKHRLPCRVVDLGVVGSYVSSAQHPVV